MLSEESNKMSKKTPSQDSNSKEDTTYHVYDMNNQVIAHSLSEEQVKVIEELLHVTHEVQPVKDQKYDIEASF